MQEKLPQAPSTSNETVVSTTPSKSVSDRFILVITLLVGAGLRFGRLDHQSLWFDEAARLLIAQADVPTIVTTTGGDTMPPLFHLMMHGWLQAGAQDFWTRLPSALAGIILIAIIYQLGKSLFDRKTGLIAGTAVSFLPYLIFHAQQANLYSIYVLLAAITTLAFWRAVQQPKNKWGWIVYGGVVLTAVYLHYFIGFIVIMQHLFALWRLRRKEIWQPLILTDVAIGIGFLPYIPIFLSKTTEVSSGFWLNSPSPLQPLLTYYLFIGSYSLPGTFFAIGLGLVLAVLLIALLDIRHQIKANPANKQAISYVLLLTFGPILLIWIISQWLPVYLDRTLLIILPAYLMTLAYALAHTHRRSPLPYLSGLLATILFFSLYNYYAVADFQKEDYRAAATAVSTYKTPGDVIVHTGNGSYIPFLIYLPPTDHFLLEGDPAPHHPPNVHENGGGDIISQEALEGYGRIILVIALDHSVEYQQQRVAEFEQIYTRVDDLTTDNIIIRIYE